MHDFIEKPSRMILFVIGLIALVTIIILLSKSRVINTGGESLVDANGKRIEAATPTPIPAVEAHNGTAGNAAEDEYVEVYVEDDAVNNEADTWVDVEVDDEAETPAEQPNDTVVIEENTETAADENNAAEAQTEEPAAEEEAVEQEEIFVEVDEGTV